MEDVGGVYNKNSREPRTKKSQHSFVPYTQNVKTQHRKSNKDSLECLVLVIIGIRTLDADRLALDMHLDTRRARPTTSTHRKLVLQPREPIVSDVLFPNCAASIPIGIGEGRGEKEMND